MQVLTSALNSSLQSLLANQLGLSVASQNISNAQTPGYSRQRMNLAPSWSDGVDVVGVEALRDQLALAGYNQETASRSAQDTLQQGLQDIQGSFNDTQGTGMLSSITAFFNSFQTLSVDPTSMSNREAVKQAGQALADAFHSQAQNLNTRLQTANQAVATDVDTINSLASQIAGLTKQIQYQENVNSPANELRDQRAQLVQKLSQTVDVKQIESKGNYELTLGNGRPLVFNGDTQPLTVQSDASGINHVQAGNFDITSEIAGGDLQGQIQLRDQMIPGYLNQLDQLAYNITQQVNGIHSAAYTLDGNTGINFFTPLAGAAGAATTISLSSNITASSRNIAAGQDPNAAGDNTAAIAIGNLLHAPVFNNGGSVTDQYGGLVYTIGSDTATAQANYKEHDALATQMQNRVQQVSGVSIDEETVSILQFQRAFQASAKVISTVDSLLQTALSMVGGTTA
jgi:flagellar hook-associated protein 1 FlgK